MRCSPSLDGLRIVDLGCGFGAFGRWAVERGAAEVLAIDVSERISGGREQTLVNRGSGTRSATSSSSCSRQVGSTSPTARWPCTTSSTCDRFVSVVYDTLEPGGHFVFTTEHPIFTAPTSPGWRQVDGNRVWPLDRYADEGERITDWLAPGVRKQHRMIGTTVSTLIDAGFTLRRLIEWRPSAAQIAADPALAEELDRPMFLLVAAQR